MLRSVCRKGLSALAILALVASFASAQSLTTTFASNNGQSGNMFDVKALIQGVFINDFDVNIDVGTWTVDVWAVTGGGTFLGNEGNPAAWTMLASTTVSSAAQDVPTNLGLSLGYLVPVGTTQGFYITVASGTGMNYTTGATGTFQTVAAADAFLEIYYGIGKALSGYPTTFGSNLGGLTPGTSGSRLWNGTVYYAPQPSLADDISLTQITAPVDSQGCDFLSTSEITTVTIRNLGMNIVPASTAIQMDLVADGGTPITEFLILANDLNPLDTLNYSFATGVDLSALGSHSIQVTATYFGDLDASNDSKTINVNSGNPILVNSFPWVENFDSTVTNNTTIPPTGWTQDLTDASGTYSDWYFLSGQTGSVNTGPVGGDHTTGSAYYAYTEDSGNFAQINLISPCIDLSTAVNPALTFWLHSFNANTTNSFENFFSLDVITYPGGVVTTDVIGPIGHQPTATLWSGSQWTQQALNLAPYNAQIVQFRFRSRTDGGSTTHDIAIDDVAVISAMQGVGQEPRAGLASFDIENAVESNGFGVQSGFAGPFFTSVLQGGSMTMEFTGEPTQAIAVLYGPLNPVAATYPGGIGQFDIGGPGVNGQGIPNNIGVFVDAISWAQGGFIGFPLDALFFTDAAGDCSVGFSFPNFGIPSGTILTSFQAAVTSSSAPFVYLSNAIEVTVN
ncbi:MAG: hypothetical protein H6807_03285 [Planctomycetes bacterium]|nr:hypothetical protein [Planctomycetota bacterium]